MTTEELGEEAEKLLLACALDPEKNRYDQAELTRREAARQAILDAPPILQIEVLIKSFKFYATVPYHVRASLQVALLTLNLPYTIGDLVRLWEATQTAWVRPTGDQEATIWQHIHRVIPNPRDIPASLRTMLEEAHRSLLTSPAYESNWETINLLESVLGLQQEGVLPYGSGTWASSIVAQVNELPPAKQKVWKHLFFHARSADGAKPTQKWKDGAKVMIAAAGDDFVPNIVRWLSTVVPPTSNTGQRDNPNAALRASGTTLIETPHEIVETPFYLDHGTKNNLNILKGLAWYCANRTEPEVARALATMTEACLRKIPGIGPWGVRAAGAGVWALGEMPPESENVAALAQLRLRVTYRTTLTQIDKTLETLARKRGLPREELEDLSVSTYGLDGDGRRRETWGDYAAELRLDPTGAVSLSFFGANGKPLKAAPAALKTDHADDLKALKADADALQKTLAAQKQRLENTYLPARIWQFGIWRERYLHHPLLGNLSRRLIWRFMVDTEQYPGIWSDAANGFADAEGAALPFIPDTAIVQLWHPLHGTTDAALRWRQAVEAREIRQPFKQAHREIYLLTAAEENTKTYSNRFAGHILKQHQMNQLAAQRGWQNKLRLLVDDQYPPAILPLPGDLRCEFWIEGAGEEYGRDTNETGTFLYLTTDQVRFYPVGAPSHFAHAAGGGYEQLVRGENRAVEPIPLSEIPPIVFSEAMRDVDLFVGVASIGNDPNWVDGGGDIRYRQYWADYSFGDLTETAKTRAEALARLLPRLKIADRCRIDGRFLMVQGDLRLYKIHLGSGNILMEPGDQYLCIVERRYGTDGSSDALFLPFEGDNRLSLILSKAFLLADDTNIKDSTITAQIRIRKPAQP